MTNNDPLRKLISEEDVQAADRKKIADFLAPLILIDNASKELSFLPDFEKVGLNADKIEIILLACKARSLLFKTPNGLTQGEIIALDIMPEGSVKSTLKKLFDPKKIKKDKEARYFLPGYRVSELVNNHSNKN